MSGLSDAMERAMGEDPAMTKSKMARACDVTPTAVGRWLTGTAPEESRWPLIDAYLGWPEGRTASLVTPELTGRRRSTADATTAALRARIVELEAEVIELRAFRDLVAHSGSGAAFAMAADTGNPDARPSGQGRTTRRRVESFDPDEEATD